MTISEGTNSLFNEPSYRCHLLHKQIVKDHVQPWLFELAFSDDRSHEPSIYDDQLSLAFLLESAFELKVRSKPVSDASADR